MTWNVHGIRLAHRSRTRLPSIETCCLALLMLTAPGCRRDDPTLGDGEWRAQVDTLGDTIVVRTLSGSQWGAAKLVAELQIGTLDGPEYEIFGDVAGLAVTPAGGILIYDRQVPALRRFSSDGRYLGTLGRSGAGPGEYANSDGGLAVLKDGRIVLRDPGNARLTVYAADGSYLESWPIPGGRFTSVPMVAAADGGFYNPIFGDGQPLRLVRYGQDGRPADTLPRPEPQIQPATVQAQTEGASQTWLVPFSQAALWTFHPQGYYLSAITGQYAIDALRPGGPVLRVARVSEPVPVTPEELAVNEERVTTAMRRLVPSWRWNGPSIPRIKPILRGVQAGEDGRLWVLLHQPGERVPEDELDPEPGAGPPSPQFREPTVFDVFEEDGRYLGRVSAPPGFSIEPRPVFRGGHVWAIDRDKLGVQRVIRYRILPQRTGARVDKE